jgi:tryptophan synthase beta chain
VYLSATDDEAISAVELLAERAGIIVALETAHAFAKVSEIARRERVKLGRAVRIAVCCSGRGDKDLATISSAISARNAARAARAARAAGEVGR